MRALITGITGFVGTYLAEHLIDEGDQVIGCSRSGEWHEPVNGNPKGENQPAVDLHAWDITQPIPDRLRAELRAWQPEIIFHLAAISLPADCGREQPTPQARATNTGGTERIIDVAEQLGGCMVVLASSCHVYGRIDDPSHPVSEDCPANPVNGYGITKWEAEQHLMSAVASGRCGGMIARGFQQTGPRQSPRLLLPEWAQQFASRRDPVVVRSLNTTLDLMDVRDSSRLMRKLALHGKSGDCCNVGSGQAHSGIELATLLSQQAGYEPTIEQTDPRHFANPIADTTRADSIAGKLPLTPIETTVADTLRYWRP